MYKLRRIGFFVSLITLVGGALAILLMLFLGSQISGQEDLVGDIVGLMLIIIAFLGLVVVVFITVLMVFYQKTIIIPFIFLIIFGLISIRISSNDTPLIYITAGLTLGPLLTILGYFFKEKPNNQ